MSEVPESRLAMHGKVSAMMQVSHGRTFDAVNPTEEGVFIEDIAHSLSHQCRFGGHTKVFYSVAEHSVRVSLACLDEDALWGLLHDASEAYLVDLPSPIKYATPIGKAYTEVEDGLMKVITRKYGLGEEMPESVRAADNTLLGTEVRDLLIPDDKPEMFELWDPWLQQKPLPGVIKPLTSDTAKIAFLARFHILDLRKENEVVDTT